MTHSSNPSAHNTTVGLLAALTLSIHVCIGGFATQSAYAAVTDVQINALVSQAIDTHPLVGSARAERQATMEGVTAAKLNLLPTPNVSAGYDNDDEFVSQFVVRQPLWTAGRLTANVNQALFDDKAAIEYVFEQQNEVAKITIDAWQSYINAVARQRVSIQSLKTLNEFEEMMQRRVAQGVSAPIELNLVSNRILQEQNAYQAAAEQQRIAAARLEQIIGEPISQSTALNVPDLGVLVRQVKEQSVPFERMAFNQASFYNPTVVKEAYQVESAKQELAAQQSALYPHLYAQYERKFYDNKDNDDGRFSIGLDYTPGAGFSSLALSRASGARVDSLIESKEAARRSVMEDIQVKYQQFVSAKNRELSLEAAVAGAQIVVDSYRRQFIAGRKKWAEVLNALRELNDYQTQLAQTRSEILGSFYKLQVDFGLMPWQQFANDRKPIELFQPYSSVQEWLEERKHSAQLRQAGRQTPEKTQTLLTPSQLSFSDADDLASYYQPDVIDYDTLSTATQDAPPPSPYDLPSATQAGVTDNDGTSLTDTHSTTSTDVVKQILVYTDQQNNNEPLVANTVSNTVQYNQDEDAIIIPLGVTSLADYLTDTIQTPSSTSHLTNSKITLNKVSDVAQQRITEQERLEEQARLTEQKRPAEQPQLPPIESDQQEQPTAEKTSMTLNQLDDNLTKNIVANAQDLVAIDSENFDSLDVESATNVSGNDDNVNDNSSNTDSQDSQDSILLTAKPYASFIKYESKQSTDAAK